MVGRHAGHVELVACQKIQEHIQSARCYTDDTQTHRLPDAQL